MDTLSLGSTYRFTPNKPGTPGSGPAGETGVLKDGQIWDLTAATVELLLRKPDGTLVPLTATITNAVLGLVEYLGTTSDLDTEGEWKLSWHFTQGSIDVIDPSIPIPFNVRVSP